MPLVSVLIPTYNRPHLVQEAVASVLAQKAKCDFEIIVIDDGSTAETAQALEKYRGALRYVRRENHGLNPSRNHGVGLATGDYIALLDDDDVWLPFKTQLQLTALERFPNAAFVHSNFDVWKPGVARTPDGLRTWFAKPYAWHELYAQTISFDIPDYAQYELSAQAQDAYCGDLYYWSLIAPMVLPSTAIVRRSAVASGARFPEFDSTGDWEFFTRLSRHQGAVFLPLSTTLNRSHEDATRLTRTDPSVRLRRRIAMIHRLWRQDAAFLAEHGRVVDEVEATCWRKLARLYVASGDNRQARDALRKMRQLTSGNIQVQDHLLSVLAHLPFAAAMVGGVRKLRSMPGIGRR